MERNKLLDFLVWSGLFMTFIFKCYQSYERLTDSQIITNTGKSPLNKDPFPAITFCVFDHSTNFPDTPQDGIKQVKKVTDLFFDVTQQK